MSTPIARAHPRLYWERAESPHMALDAAWAGDLAALRAALDGGEDVNAADWVRRTRADTAERYDAATVGLTRAAAARATAERVDPTSFGSGSRKDRVRAAAAGARRERERRKLGAPHPCRYGRAMRLRDATPRQWD